MDREAFESLYSKMERSLFNTTYAWVFNEAEALDLVHDAFVKLWMKRRTIRPEGAAAYVTRIALNLAANRHRRHKILTWMGLEHSADVTAPDRSAERQIIDRERVMSLRRALDTLPAKYRDVILLCRYSGFSYATVGEILDIPEGTVASRLNKAICILKEELT